MTDPFADIRNLMNSAEIQCSKCNAWVKHYVPVNGFLVCYNCIEPDNIMEDDN